MKRVYPIKIVGLVIVAALLGRCRTFTLPSNCEGEAADRTVLIRRVTPAQIRVEFLRDVNAESLPGEPRRAVEEWIDGEIAALSGKSKPGDEIWFYMYEKCCGWYRAGYYLVRRSCVIAEINTREDM